MNVSKVRLNKTFSFPATRDPAIPSAVVMDMSPTAERNGIRLSITLVVMPIVFVDTKGKPTGYSVGCREANFSLNISPGTLSVVMPPALRFSFEREIETGTEKSKELRPRIEANASTTGIGGATEAGARVSKDLHRDRLKIAGKDDAPILSAVRRSTVGWIQWTISNSHLVPRSAVLRCSKTVSVVCHWPDLPGGAIRMYAPRYVFNADQRELVGTRRILAAFWHWAKCLKYRNDLREELFEITRHLNDD